MCDPQGLSIVELGVLIIFNQFELLAEKHFVDHSGKLSTEQAREIRPRHARDAPEMRPRCTAHPSPRPARSPQCSAGARGQRSSPLTSTTRGSGAHHRALSHDQ